jgi:hypothetical protein
MINHPAITAPPISHHTEASDVMPSCSEATHIPTMIQGIPISPISTRASEFPISQP